MILPPIAEISRIRILDRGVANKERIAIKFSLPSDLGAFCLVCGTTNFSGGIVPSRNHLFILPDEEVEADTWVIVYTGVGERRWTTLRNSGSLALVLHWGRKKTLFDNPLWTAGVFLIAAFQGAEDS